MTHVKALEAGQSSQGTSEPITPAFAFNILHDWVAGSNSLNRMFHH